MNTINEPDPKIQKCIDACGNCYEVCAATFKHCMDMGGPHALPKHINTLKDCMDICKMTQDFMLRDSEHLKCIADECEKICELCAQSCEETDPNDEQMKACVAACRQCATACKDILMGA
jgi:hypothetical protein